MDNRWHKKESPLQGMTGLWGGNSSNLVGGGVPATEYGVLLWGAGGGASVVNGSGGCGGYTKLKIELPIGTYYATAGVKGYNAQNAGHDQRGAGGNGLRYYDNDQGGSGGGFSGIWANNTYSGNPIVLVGGGGGSEWVDQGGNGGGVNVNGGTGWDRINDTEYSPNARPIGATLTAGGFYDLTYGPAACRQTAQTGIQLRGGDSNCTDQWGGGGGGGGYWGGGAGSANVGQGGTPGSGGSGFGDTDNYEITIVTNTTSAQRVQTFNTYTSEYAQTNHPGGTRGKGAAQGGNGEHGMVEIWNATFTSLLHQIDGPTENGSFTITA